MFVSPPGHSSSCSSLYKKINIKKKKKTLSISPLAALGSELTRPLGRSTGSCAVISPSSIPMNKPERFTEMLMISVSLSPHCATCGLQ